MDTMITIHCPSCGKSLTISNLTGLHHCKWCTMPFVTEEGGLGEVYVFKCRLVDVYEILDQTGSKAG